MTEELLPCPFCGGDAKLYRVGNDHHKWQEAVVDCNTSGCCGIQKVRIFTDRMTYEWAQKKVIEKWNTRAQPKYKRVDLYDVRLFSTTSDVVTPEYSRGYREAFDDIKSKYGDLYVEVK